MTISPYEKLCIELIGGLPDNRRGVPSGKKPTATALARKMGINRKTIFCWPLVPGTNIRIIPPSRAGIIEKLSGGAVTAEEIRDFAKRHQFGDEGFNRGRV
ncbi:hypothetical protein [Endozoicomonas ascidiicola]|uniref:hypothetical protein n=1 Tax=Endozoicomonas ascidiicola TaxID=1698521 RepID=UPI00082BB459|nr:hypothetical protein [Endozoicomonas ascidiicola]